VYFFISLECAKFVDGFNPGAIVTMLEITEAGQKAIAE
jgi:hypothetical protein